MGQRQFTKLKIVQGVDFFPLSDLKMHSYSTYEALGAQGVQASLSAA